MAANGDNYMDYWYEEEAARPRHPSSEPQPQKPGGDGAWGTGQPLATALGGEIGDSSLGHSDLPGPSTGQDVPYFSQAASPFPGWEEKQGTRKMRSIGKKENNGRWHKEFPAAEASTTTTTMRIGPWSDLWFNAPMSR
ncbi:hypothetical protein C8A03DRAFT_36609 [Achaetomium macrosporum]|uniref:Uncharacterized protein n=1 Tax=Achaetomium macrosporum TaxID=79813 RepID=A0AAN7H8U3_9PEZI|nr:hypothetical protein C8A03DRAFT_36609 [Achaetomium macrosporum]